MFYAVRHFTRYRYSRAVRQSVMEVRMHPRSEHMQRCFTFQLSVSPRSRIFSYTDHMGNLVHHFDIPAPHRHLTIIADSLIDVDEPDPLPASLGVEAWKELDEMIGQEDYWDMLGPSHYARSSPELLQVAKDFGVERRDGRDPLELLVNLNSTLFREFSYVKQSTNVDSPIEHALRSRQGVCQDFAHIMIALVRNLRIPCRYVSGYLYHEAESKDRSSTGATHAWVEAFLGDVGWVAFDPTNQLVGSERHIRVALGRDYADVAPTRGVYKGDAESTLSVVVTVAPVNSAASVELPPPTVIRSKPLNSG